MIALGNRGSLAEHIAVAYLLREGYEVYRNVSSHGPIDLIATRGPETLRLDVKTSYKFSTRRGLKARQRELGVKLLLVKPGNGECLICDAAPELDEVHCRHCGKPFMPIRENQQFCNSRCGAQAGNRERSVLVKIGREALAARQRDTLR